MFVPNFYPSWPSRHRFTFLTIWYCWYFLYSSFGWYREIQSGDMMLCQFVLVLCCWWLFAVLQITSIGVCLYFDLLFHLSVVYLQVQHWLCVVLPAGVGPWMASRKSWIHYNTTQYIHKGKTYIHCDLNGQSSTVASQVTVWVGIWPLAGISITTADQNCAPSQTGHIMLFAFSIILELANIAGHIILSYQVNPTASGLLPIFSAFFLLWSFSPTWLAAALKGVSKSFAKEGVF